MSNVLACLHLILQFFVTTNRRSTELMDLEAKVACIPGYHKELLERQFLTDCHRQGSVQIVDWKHPLTL